MKPMDTLNTIRRLAAETLDVPDETLLRATTLQDAGIDSLAAIDLVFAVEGFYGVTIAAEELQNMHSLRDLAASVDRLTSHEIARREMCDEA